MQITNMRVNHIPNPIGYDLTYQTFTWTCCGESEMITESCLEISKEDNFRHTIFQSGYRSDITGVGYALQLEVESCCRYYWRIIVRTDQGNTYTSGNAFFETGKLTDSWDGKWICIEEKGGHSPIVRKNFTISGPVQKVTGYMTGLGLYEAYMNGQLINDGYLQPGFNNYKYWMQYQTYDLTEKIIEGKNTLSFLLGAGWYKGRFGVNGGYENQFGEHYHLLCELHIAYADGSEDILGSDDSYLWTDGPIVHSNIYDGEIYDAMQEPDGWQLPGFDDSEWKPVGLKAPENFTKLFERYSIPVTVKEILRPLAVLKGPQGETILDVGQNVSGWLVFKSTLKRGQKICFKHVELLQDGTICRKNLLTAKQEFVYTSNGKEELVRPHFTYYGFRYIQIEGVDREITADDFQVWNLYSDLKTTGSITTGNEQVNQLISNAFWSQRDNFVDQPTDCPQRAERLGWTGDAQMYCATACLFMYTPAFFRKYMKDVNEDQKHEDGKVTFIIPRVKARDMGSKSDGDITSAAWSDAATIIPWTLYLYYGDKNLLAEEYDGMKAWVDHVIEKDKADGHKHLWQTGFHFGDWLALDNPEPGPFGLTDKYYIASCYYYYSTLLLSKAARVLENKHDTEFYSRKAAKIKEAILNEYFTGDGICKINTQTAYVLAIYMDLVTGEALKKNADLLVEKICQNDTHLDTGFVGTTYLCLALSKTGYSQVAYDLLLKNDYPSWLYQVEKGATTVWESWDALKEDGTLKGDSSLNHYAFGSIVEWLYRDVCGINPLETHPGFSKALLEPKPDKRLGFANVSLDTNAGQYKLKWYIKSEKQVQIDVSIPYSGSAELKLPDGSVIKDLKYGTYQYICAI